ncbi:MAG: hypothetical protein FWD61_04030 [Phycisphaerales bacterium]|nr:hypothetical protein [Phycisphaerales bacterium]
MNFTKKTSAAVAALTLTAILLGVILLASSQQSAQAGMLNAQSDFSLMTAGPFGATDESLIIIDKSSQTIVIYSMVNNRFNLIGGHSYASTTPSGKGGR